MTRRVIALDPQTYKRHALHTAEGRVWAETNCYVDVLIELIHALGHDPRAALAFTFAIDFEGDQWTFFKFPLPDLFDLFRLDVQELAIWRPLVAHIDEQVDRGRPVLVELDSFYLPDTAGTAYKIAHVKSTVAVVEIDVAQERLGYFHGQGYYHLDGSDFRGALGLADSGGEPRLPPYAEFMKIRAQTSGGDALLSVSLRLLQKHLELVPAANPFVAFKARFQADLDALLEQSLDVFHQYSFATLRQYGACYELAARYLQWLEDQGEAGLSDLTRAFLELSEGAKSLQFQLARAMARRRPLDLSALDTMAATWHEGVSGLRARYS